MEPEETAGGLSYLIKSVTPLIGRVGAVASGVIGLLLALEKVSGEIITTIEGFLLVVAVVASAVVVWGKHTREVIGVERSLPLYPRRHRRIALVALVLSAVLTLLFTVRVAGDYVRSEDVTRQAAADATIAAATVGAQVPVAAGTQAPQAAGTVPAGGAQPRPTSVFGRIGDVKTLNQMGFDALATRNYTVALPVFLRALEVNATSAQAQLGLGEAYYFAAQYPPAVLPLRTALQLDSSQYDAHAYLGLVYEQRNDAVRAKVELDEYLRVAPADAALRVTVTDALKHLSGPSGPPRPAPSSTPAH